MFFWEWSLFSIWNPCASFKHKVWYWCLSKPVRTLSPLFTWNPFWCHNPNSCKAYFGIWCAWTVISHFNLTKVGLVQTKLGEDNDSPTKLAWGAPHLLLVWGPYNLCGNQYPHEMTVPADCVQGQRNAHSLRILHGHLHCWRTYHYIHHTTRETVTTTT